jgi:hypothetical protein
VFVLAGRATHQERADRFLEKIRWVRRTIAARTEPFMAKISMSSGDHHITTLDDLMNRYARRRR